jgi:hypothetical protein
MEQSDSRGLKRIAAASRITLARFPGYNAESAQRKRVAWPV